MQYFNFHKLYDYLNMLESIAIFTMVVFVVWTLASLYYWSTEDLRLRHYVAPKKDKDLT